MWSFLATIAKLIWDWIKSLRKTPTQATGDIIRKTQLETQEAQDALDADTGAVERRISDADRLRDADRIQQDFVNRANRRLR